MLRVAHILRKYDPSEWGGTETHVAEVTRRMFALGVESEVYAPAGPAASGGLPPGVPLRRYAAFCPFLGSAEQVRALIASSGNIVSIQLALRLAADTGLALAHLHTGNRIGGAARTAMRITGRPYIISIHGPLWAQPHVVAAEMKRRSAGVFDFGQPFGLAFGARRVLEDAARVITFNDDEYRAVLAKVGRAHAVRMDHGVDAARIESGDPVRATRRFPELGRAPVIALIGRVCAQKNQILAVRAFAKGAPSDHHLALAGAETDPGYKNLVLQEARALGVADRVHLLGNLDRELGVPDLLARSKLVLVPSTHEAFGLAVLEGWAASRVVLFAKSSGLCDLGRAAGDDAPMFDVNDLGAWSAAIDAYCTRAQLREAEASKGRRLVRERFGWDAVVARLASLYEEVINERRRSEG